MVLQANAKVRPAKTIAMLILLIDVMMKWWWWGGEKKERKKERKNIYHKLTNSGYYFSRSNNKRRKRSQSDFSWGNTTNRLIKLKSHFQFSKTRLFGSDVDKETACCYIVWTNSMTKRNALNCQWRLFLSLVVVVVVIRIVVVVFIRWSVWDCFHWSCNLHLRAVGKLSSRHITCFHCHH